MHKAILHLLLLSALVASLTAQDVPKRPATPSPSTLSAPTSQIAAWYRWAVYQEALVAARDKEILALKAQLANQTPGAAVNLEPIMAQLSAIRETLAVRPPSLVVVGSDAVALGAKVTFYATADGSPPPTFQWIKNGADIPGATAATYVILAATAADAASYMVRATNPAGSASSAALNLKVAP